MAMKEILFLIVELIINLIITFVTSLSVEYTSVEKLNV
jgi:hypothetical protein